MLNQYDRGVDAVILRHEMRYDVLSEFGQYHQGFVKPLVVQATQSASKEDASILSSTQAFIKDRAIYKRDYVDASMSLRVNAKLVRTLAKNLEAENAANAQSGSPFRADHSVFTALSSSSGIKSDNRELRPELLVANVCLARGLSLKRKLHEHIAGYDSFVDSLSKFIEPGITGDEDLRLPLHDYGAYSQGGGTAEEDGAMPPPRKDKDSLADIVGTEQGKLEKIVEVQLMRKLRDNVSKVIEDTRRLEDAYMTRVGSSSGSGSGSGGGSSNKRKRRN